MSDTPYGLPEIPSTRFFYDNSMAYLGIPQPFQVSLYGDDDVLEKVKWYTVNDWVPVGFTRNPPGREKFSRDGHDSIGVMFERPNGEQAWTHFPV